MRIGKPLEYVDPISQSFAEKDELLKIGTLGKSSFMVIYLVYDMLSYVSAIFYKFC